MNVKVLTMKERNTLMKEGACFKCRKKGHMAKDCLEGIPVTQEKKSIVKDLVTQIQTMTREEKMKFVELTKIDDEEKADF